MPTSLGLKLSPTPQDVTSATAFGSNALVEGTSYSAQNTGNVSVYVGEQASTVDIDTTVPFSNTIGPGKSQLINPVSGFTIYVWIGGKPYETSGLLVCNEIA